MRVRSCEKCNREFQFSPNHHHSYGTPSVPYDAILTTMINFRDALKQKDDAYGVLWADEDVYHIAKEIQLFSETSLTAYFLV